MQKTPVSNLAYDASTTVGARNVSGYPEHAWDGGDTEIAFPDTTSPRVFDVDQIVLIWYRHDGCWYEGKVICFRGLDNCQVEFCAGGPRIRNWFQLSHGLVRPDTPSDREYLKTQGFAIVPNPRR